MIARPHLKCVRMVYNAILDLGCCRRVDTHMPTPTTRSIVIGVVNVNGTFLLCYVFGRFNKATAVHRTIFCDTCYKFHNVLDHKISAA